jgi:alcohol dehydrogenase (cytochrome c)
MICFFNTRSYWPTAYHPGTNSLYVPYIDNCLDMTAGDPPARDKRGPIPRPGGDPNAFTGLARINLSTGEILRFNQGRSPSTGAVLTTAGDLVFHGDMNRRFRAFDAYSGKQLWEGIVGGHVAVSTISYAAKGKQYVAIMTGDGLLDASLLAETPELKTPRGSNAIFVFALP